MGAILKSLDDNSMIAISNGEVKNASDFNLKTDFLPIKGGLYDQSIFGGVERCGCRRNIRRIGDVCRTCGAKVMIREDANKTFGHYTLHYPVIYDHKVLKLFSMLEDVHPVFSAYGRDEMGKSVKTSSRKLLENIWNTKMILEPILGPLVEDDSKFLVKDDMGGTFSVGFKSFEESDESTEITFYGPSGLKKLASRYTPVKGSIKFINEFVNQIIMVMPASLRPASHFKIGGIKKTKIPMISSLYRAVIQIDNQIKTLFEKYSDLSDQLTLLYTMNKLVNLTFDEYSITKTSKENLFRNLLSSRVKKSGRSNIVGDPTLPVDTVKLPRSLLYEALKSDIIRGLEKAFPTEDSIELYLNPKKETLKIFSAIVDDCAAILIRNPSIHKFNALAFKVEMTDEITIGLPLLVTGAFNADFDGDQMAFYLITEDPYKSDALAKMSPKNVWFYESKREPIYVPNTSILQGLYLASEPYSEEDDESGEYSSFADLEAAFKADEVDVNEMVYLEDLEMYEEGFHTTYGRLKLHMILDISLDDIIGDGERITAKNIGKIIGMLGARDDRVKRVQDLQTFALEIVTTVGVTTLSVEEVFQVEDYEEEVNKVLNSDDPEAQKYRDLNELLPGIVARSVENLPSSNLSDIMAGSGKIKMNALMEILGPRIEYSPEDGVKVHIDSLAKGSSEVSYIHHARDNRKVLQYKKENVPTSGYTARQIVDLVFDITYNSNCKSSDSVGVVMNAKDAVGRLDINDRMIESNPDNVKVRVKSFVNSGDNYICPDEMNQANYSYENDQPVGIPLMMELTRDVTQSALSLKHGGALQIPTDERIVALRDGEIKHDLTTDRILTLDFEGTPISYILPEKYIKSKKWKTGRFSKGDVICYLDRIDPIDKPLADFIALTGSFSKTASKTKLKICYSPWDGQIIYDVNAKLIHIGTQSLPLYGDEIYYYPNGYKIKRGERICSGVLDGTGFDNQAQDIGWGFYVFHDQLRLVLKKNFNVELSEILFKAIRENGNSIRRSMFSQDKFVNQITHGYAKQNIKDFIGKDIGGGLMTRLMLGDMSEV